jgi:DNA repair protein RadA/Sms
MAKKATVFACTECGAQANKWLGRCPECNAWNSYAEEESPRGAATGLASAAPVPITQIGP